MKVIPAVSVENVLMTSEPIPEVANRVICDGINYIVYEDGDELPQEPVSE